MFCISAKISTMIPSILRKFTYSLVNTGNVLPSVFDSKVEGESRDSLALCLCHDLQRFDDSRYGHVFQARVLALGVFTDDGKVDVAVTCREPRQGLAKGDGGVDVELLTHGYVPGGVARSLDGSV